MASWTAADIPDLTGRVAIVTGANSGLGFEAARALAQHGSTVVMACRDMVRCRTAAEEIGRAAEPELLEPEQLDLSDLDSVREFAARVAARHATIDILLNNAGVMAPPQRYETRQGFELQLGTNHIGHFALTGLLLPQLLRVLRSRIVTVSSFAHESGKVVFDDLQRGRHYTPYGAYSQSKLANLLFMRELDRRLRRASTDTISVGAHPGFASTNLQAVGPFMGSRPMMSWLVLGGVRLIGQSAARGAEPQLYAATAPGVEGGEYFGPKHRMSGRVASSTMSARARDEAVASRLWDVSKELSGVDIDESIVAGAG